MHCFQNPTVVVLTDRNDLDDQLFGTFAACTQLLPESPRQASSRADPVSYTHLDVYKRQA